MRHVRTAVLSFALLAPTGLSQITIVDFEDLNSGSNPSFGTTTTAGVFTVTGGHWHAINDFTPSGGTAYSGSAVFVGTDGGSLASSWTISRTDGAAFSLTSFRGAEEWVNLPSYPNAVKIRVTGALAGGGAVVVEFPLDGINDGQAGTQDDFEMFDLTGQMASILSATFEGISASGALDGAWGIDDLDVTPGCSLPYGVGCAGEGGFVPQLRNPACDMQSGQVGFDIVDAPGGATAVLLFGLTQGAAPIGSSSCFLNVGTLLPLSISLPLGGSGPGNGFTFLNGVFPPSASGLTFTMQAAISDPTTTLGFTTTNGLETTAP